MLQRICSRILLPLCLTLLCTVGASAADSVISADNGSRISLSSVQTVALTETLPAVYSGEEVLLDGVRYARTDSGAATVGYSQDIPQNCVIPASVTIGGTAYPVTEIGENSFYNCSQLTSIQLPDSLRTIGSNAFSGCTGLVRIEIPAGVTMIGSYAPDTADQRDRYSGSFLNCSALQSITVEAGNTAYQSIDGVLYSADGTILYHYPIGNPASSYTAAAGTQVIWSYAFFACPNLTSVILPDTVTWIQSCAFQECEALESIHLGNGLQRVGSSAFFWCSSLTELSFPASLQQLDGDRYMFTSNLKFFSVAEGCANYCTIDGVLFENHGSSLTLWGYPAGNEAASYTLPAGVSVIAPYSFCDTHYLKSITFSDDLRNIETGAFQGSGLTSVTIPDGVTSVGSYAFQVCGQLETVTLGAGLQKLEDGLFDQCDSLQQVHISAGIMEMGLEVFRNCTNLASFTVAEQNPVYSAEAGILYQRLEDGSRQLAAYPPALEATQLTIPADVSAIPVGTFASAVRLTAIQAAAGNPVFSSQDGVLFRQDEGGLQLFAYPLAKTGSSYTIPDGVTSVAELAFYSNSNLKYVNTNDVTEICREAFCETALERVDLPKVELLDYGAFMMSDLLQVTLPATLEKIGSQSFDFCYDLEYLEFLSTTPPSTMSDFATDPYICPGATGLRYVYVPTGTQSSYLAFFKAETLPPGAMVVEGRYLPEESVSDLIAALPEPSGQLSAQQKEEVNKAAQAVVRLSHADAAGLTDEELLKVEQLFQAANQGISVQIDTEKVNSTQVTVEGAAVASGLAEQDTIDGEVTVTVTEQAAASQQDLLDLGFALSVDGTGKQLQAPVIITVDLTEEMEAAYATGTLELVHRDGSLSETIPYTVEDSQATFRAASFSSYVFRIRDDTIQIRYNANSSAVLYLAGYDGTGRMVSINSFHIDAPASGGVLTAPRQAGVIFKAFVLDSKGCPVGSAELVSDH